MFTELQHLERTIESLGPHARVERLARVEVDGHDLPVWGLSIGCTDPGTPSLILVGGVHGLERIGARVVTAFLETLSMRLRWDELWRAALSRARIVAVPLLNPGGMLRRTRANPRGVDLMRNAPVDRWHRSTFLLGGQRISRHLPWYTGRPERGMEVESRALCDFVLEALDGCPAALALDCHSGFGLVDRIWFPYARTHRPLPHLAEVVGIRRLLDGTLPNHVYRVEPTAQTYTIAGDLWDYLYDAQRARAPDAAFVPLTLEMGSWAWVRKNPRQLWSAAGSFNPVLPHRLQRTLRRHLPLIDFLFHAVVSAGAWTPRSESERLQLEQEAFRSWSM